MFDGIMYILTTNVVLMGKHETKSTQHKPSWIDDDWKYKLIINALRSGDAI